MNNYDFHAAFPFASQNSAIQAFALQWLLGETGQLPPAWPELNRLSDPAARIAIVTQAIATPHRERVRSGIRGQPSGYRRWVAQAQAFIRERRALMEQLGLLPALPDLAQLPLHTWVMHIPFTLRQPYLSKDDRIFHLLDNPVKKEWVFDVPMLAASGWKGAFRAALRAMGYPDTNEIMVRLCGNPRESDEQQAGRLHFFPTFFDQLGLEVINPHDRETSVGERGPIMLECAPQGARGDFVLLYVPSGHWNHAELAADLPIVARAVQVMLAENGFGAKTSSGYGVADERLPQQGMLAWQGGATSPQPSAPESPPANLARYLETPARLHPHFRRDDGSLKSEDEYRAWLTQQGKMYTKADQQLYQKAKQWWEREGRELWQQLPAPPPPTDTPAVTSVTFHTLSELVAVADQVAAQWQAGGEG